jgi:hypothetical protein
MTTALCARRVRVSRQAAKHAKKGKAWVQNRIMPVLLFFAIFASSRETCLPLWLSLRKLESKFLISMNDVLVARA